MRALLALLTLLAAVLAAATAAAVDRNFAGSVQLDYHFVPTARDANANAGTGTFAFDGFTVEAAAKVAVDISDHLSANVKLCFGCHGFEADMAYFDYRVGDELNVRFGRFSPTFGSFNLRHDPANHRLSDKPLPYDMGRMLRMRAWNMGVLPAPFPDNGIEINGTHWFGEKTQLDYAVYAVSGFRAGAKPFDIAFAQSHFLGPNYYIDNNARPTVGSRIGVTQKLGTLSDLSLGVSGMYGTYDPANQLTYAIVGADVVLRLNRTNIRMEYLVRRTEFDTGDQGRLVLTVPPGSSSDFVVKHGAYVELEQPLSKSLDLIGRLDGLYRVGNYLQDPSGDTPLLRRSSVYRYTLGTTFAVERGLRLKLSTELWQFSDRDKFGHDVDVGVHVAAVGTF